MRELFWSGKRKIITIPLGIFFSFIFLPFVIGGGLAYIINKKIPGKKIRMLLLTPVILLTLFVGSAWLVGIFLPPKSTTTQPTPKAQVTITKNIAGVKTTLIPTITINPTPSPTTDPRQVATVSKVIDGDTIVVAYNNISETIRIIGINTPETNECLGVQATTAAQNYFKDSGNKVWLEADPTQGERDKYRRLLRFVFTDDGAVDYGKITITMGLAREYTYDKPYKYQSLYKTAQKEAQEKKIGLWSSECDVKKITIIPTKPQLQPTTQSQNTTQQNYNSAGTTTTSQESNSSSGGDKDCSDFATHADAQAFFISQGGPSSDPHRLDGDHDGSACETLP